MERVDAPSSLHVNNPKMMHIITWLEEEQVRRDERGGERGKRGEGIGLWVRV